MPRSRGRGKMHWTALAKQNKRKGKHFPGQIINPRLNHKFEPYLEVRSYVDI